MSKTASDNTAFIVASIRSMADAEAGELLSGAERDARALLAAGKKAVREKLAPGEARHARELLFRENKASAAPAEAYRYEMAKAREAAMAVVFEKAAAGIAAFAASDAYEAFLHASAKKIVGLIGKQAVEIARKKEDARFDGLLKGFFEDASFTDAADIAYGGIRVKVPGDFTVYDDTLDARFAAEKAAFPEKSGIGRIGEAREGGEVE